MAYELIDGLEHLVTRWAFGPAAQSFAQVTQPGLDLNAYTAAASAAIESSYAAVKREAYRVQRNERRAANAAARAVASA